MKFYYFEKYMIGNIKIAFSDLPWDATKDDDPFYPALNNLKKCEFISEDDMKELMDELSEIVIRSIERLSLEEESMDCYLDIAECAINCLHYVKTVYDRPHLEVKE